MKFPEWIMFTALVIATGTALARPRDPDDTQRPTQQTGSFERYDADGNGKLSVAELAKHPMGAHAQMADADGDGLLDESEFTALEAMEPA
jgi:Ca2+-binding EF-hand superfamily protein